MRYDTAMKRKIFLKVIYTKPHLSVSNANELLDRLLECDEVLSTNIQEWTENKTFSDIWVNDKYCINAVMEIRGSSDFLSAIIALDDYLKDESKEYALWQPRA